MIILRFRDLMTPRGQTIARHAKISDEHGYVYWGWIMRGDERFPREELGELKRSLTQTDPTILLFHTGIIKFFSAKLCGLAARPTGRKFRAPSAEATPAYMHESECSAWFKFKRFDELPSNRTVTINAMPTLAEKPTIDKEILSEDVVDPRKLATSTATLWLGGAEQ